MAVRLIVSQGDMSEVREQIMLVVGDEQHLIRAQGAERPGRCAATDAPFVLADVIRDSPKLNHPRSCIMLHTYTAWRNTYGSDRLTQIAVHRNCQDAEGQCPPALHSPHRQRVGTGWATPRRTRTRLESRDHPQRHA